MVASGLSAVNLDDFDATLVPRTRDDRAAATLQQVWRYGESGGSAALRVVAVVPEVRVTARQVLSLDDDRMVMAVDLNASITRAGVFSLSFAVPDGLEVEALTGVSLSQWTQAQAGRERIVTLHLNGRTLGEQAFSLTLGGPAPRAPQASWAVPRITVREARRQSGEVLVVPGRGLRLRLADRAKVTQIDPQSVGGMLPGTLAFRLLEEGWELHLGIEALEPWITVQSLQEVTLREGQVLERIGLKYRVENAAVKQLRIRLPGLGEERERTVRATGSAVTDMVRVAGQDATCGKSASQRAIAGETDVQIECQGPSAGGSTEWVLPPSFPGARQAEEYACGHSRQRAPRAGSRGASRGAG